jgi:hypothetical protein
VVGYPVSTTQNLTRIRHVLEERKLFGFSFTCRVVLYPVYPGTSGSVLQPHSEWAYKRLASISTTLYCSTGLDRTLRLPFNLYLRVGRGHWGCKPASNPRPFVLSTGTPVSRLYVELPCYNTRTHTSRACGSSLEQLSILPDAIPELHHAQHVR